MASRAPKAFLDSSVLMAAAISHRGSARELIGAEAFKASIGKRRTIANRSWVKVAISD